MSAFDCSCSPCEPTTVVEVPGSAGDDGTNGVNGFTTVATQFVVPAKGDLVVINATNASAIGTFDYIAVGLAGYFLVEDVLGNSIAARYLDIDSNVRAGQISTVGQPITVSGPPISFTPPTSLTNNTGGVPQDTLAAGVGIQTLAFFISATAIANGDVLTNYVPGYAFRIVKFDARCAAPVTTAAKAATLNLEIVSTDLTGGIIQLSGTYAQGAAQSGSAITGNNFGSATDSFSIEASSVTAFMEGAFWLIVSIQNIDSVVAFASLAGKTNEIITALS